MKYYYKGVAKSMKYFYMICLMLMAVSFNSAAVAAEGNSKFYIDGQIHPDFSIKIVINGKLVREVIPGKDKVKIFVFDLDNDLIKTGENIVGVQYNVVRKIDKDVGSSRSFRFNIRYQADADDNSKVEKLIKIKGLEKPFPEIGITDKIIETFEFGS